MRERLQRFMQGRYGVDQLSNFIVVVAVVLLVIELFLPSFKIRSIVNLVAVCMLVYSYFRIFSRNHYKRYAENERFLKYFDRTQRWFTKKQKRFAQRKTHRFFKCPCCKQFIRVPKGKGKIAITCPKCSTEFIRRS